jgi:hypothetical protein
MIINRIYENQTIKLCYRTLKVHERSWANIVELITGGKRNYSKKDNPVPIRPPQSPHVLPSKRTRVSRSRSRRPTTWAKARPSRVPDFISSGQRTALSCALTCVGLIVNKEWTQMRKYLYRRQESAECRAGRWPKFSERHSNTAFKQFRSTAYPVLITPSMLT